MFGATADFNNDGDSGTDADIEAFFRVLAGGPLTPMASEGVIRLRGWAPALRTAWS
jgi:hypothetical protein